MSTVPVSEVLQIPWPETVQQICTAWLAEWYPKAVAFAEESTGVPMEPSEQR